MLTRSAPTSSMLPQPAAPRPVKSFKTERGILRLIRIAPRGVVKPTETFLLTLDHKPVSRAFQTKQGGLDHIMLEWMGHGIVVNEIVE